MHTVEHITDQSWDVPVDRRSIECDTATVP